MRRAKICHESFIHFPTLYVPPNVSESECNSQQLALMEGLYIPEPGVLLALANQLDNLRMAPPRPKATNPESRDRHGTKDETPKKIKLGDRDTPKKHHKSHEEKSQLKHSLTEKSPTSSGSGSSMTVEVEEEPCKSTSHLTSTTTTEGTKAPRGHGVALTSNTIQLVPNLPPNPALAPHTNLPPEKECNITLGDTPRPIPAGHGALSSLPSSPLTGGMGVPAATGRSTIRSGQAVI